MFKGAMRFNDSIGSWVYTGSTIFEWNEISYGDDDFDDIKWTFFGKWNQWNIFQMGKLVTPEKEKPE